MFAKSVTSVTRGRFLSVLQTMQFPTSALLPKRETQSFQFQQAHPDYDGRDTVIAVLDTGVDPGAPGLKSTLNGLPKIIDIIDCTGSGDVPCTSTGKAESGTIRGLSGRLITIGNWENPSGIYRLGLKHSLELFPKTLVDRLQKVP